MSSVRVNFEGVGGKSLDGASEVMVYGEIPVFVNGQQVYTPEPQFQVGDYVRVSKTLDNFGPQLDMVGKIVGVAGGVFEVEFPELTTGHKGISGEPGNKHHWNFGPNVDDGPLSALELIDRPGRE